jgi:hypothetical protein
MKTAWSWAISFLSTGSKERTRKRRKKRRERKGKSVEHEKTGE